MSLGPAAATIPRPRVEGRLRAALERGPVILVAPAGYGKTAALTGALRGWPGPVVWHACGARDGDPGWLLVALLRALRERVPGAADLLLEQLGQPGEAVEPTAVVGALLHELTGLLVEPLVVVLDDGEQLADAPATLAVLDALLDADPATLRLVVAARRRPALRLARRAAAGRLTQLDETDLRFDLDECAALLERRDGTPPSPDAVLAVLEETRGWPLGVALGLGGRDTRERQLEQYLVEEVLDRLDPTRRAALLDTSVEPALTPDSPALRDVPPDLLETARGLGLPTQPVPAELLDGARRLGPSGAGAPAEVRAGGPTVGASAEERGGGSTAGARQAAPFEAVAWHPLVRDALQARWRVERPAQDRARLLAELARARLAAGRPAEAVDRWLEAGRPDDAVDAMVAATGEVLRAAPATLRAWLDRLPPDLRATSADVAWIEGRLAATEGRMRAAAERYAAAFAALDDARADTALMGISECAYFLGDPAVAAPVADVLEVPERLEERPVALLASAWLGIARAAQGDVAAGRELAERAFALPAGAFAREFEILLMVFTHVPGGGHAAVRERLVAFEAERSRLAFPEWMASIRGFVEADAGQRDEAVEQGRRMASSADRADGTQYWRSLGAVQLGWSLAIAGRHSEAETALAPLRDAGFEGWPACWIDAGLALVADASGDATEARERAERALSHGARAPLFLRCLLLCDLAPVLARAGDPQRARGLVDALLELLRARLGPDAGSHGIARLHAQRVGLGSSEPSDLQAALAGGADVVRAEWRQLREAIWEALERGDLETEPTVALVAAAFGGDLPLLELASHPSADVRRAVAPAVGASAHPSAGARLRALASDADAAVAAAAKRAGTERSTNGAPARSFRLFGAFELRRGAWPVDERAWDRPTAARLVRFLLVRRGAVPQDLILEALWPGRPPGSARSQLQVAVSRARQVLDPPGTPPAQSTIALADRAYRIVLDPRDRVDTERFAEAAAAALATPPQQRRARALARAAELWGGTPLPEERYAGWAEDWRQALESTHHRVLAALAAEQRAAGDELGVIDTARRLVAADELDEGAHRMLIEAYARTGRPALALRQFLACRRALVDGLGIEPSDETTRVQAAVLDGRPV